MGERRRAILREEIMQSEGNALPGLSEAHAMFNVLRESADPDVADAIEGLSNNNIYNYLI
jgi:hypothetical protein